MDIRKKIVLIVCASILLTAGPGSILIYGYAEHRTLEQESIVLEKVTAVFADSVQQRFSQNEPKLTALERILEVELAQPIRPGELAAFHATLMRYPDGVWRNRKPGYDGTKESGVFLPPEAAQTDEQKVRHLRIKRTLDIFGAAASKPLENVWYLSPSRSGLMFDRAFPEFSFDQKADNDYNQTPWLTYTSPRLNPKREFRFTPPLYDPVSKLWLVSALFPLYINGQWEGSIGEDMQLTSVLQAMFKSGELYAGTHHFLLDTQGNYILAGPWQKNLESTTSTFQPNLQAEPEFAALLKQKLGDKPRTLHSEVSLEGKRYLAIGMQLSPLGWSYLRLTPIDEVMAPTRRLFIALTGMLLLVTALSGLFIGTAVGRSITQRIEKLRDVMRGYANNHGLRITNPLQGNDEISEAAVVYNAMADDIDRNINQRRHAEADLHATLNAVPDMLLDLGLDGHIYAFHAPRPEMLSRPVQDFIGKRIDETMSPATVRVAHAALQEANATGHSIGREIELDRHPSKLWFELSISRKEMQAGEPPRFIALARDITERKQTERFEKFRNSTLELLVGDMPLSHVLESLVLGVEQVAPSMLCSILLLDSKGHHIAHSIAPNLPTFYTSALQGLIPAMGVGSCGTCMFNGERVIVQDIAHHPYWVDYKDLAARAGLAACWSEPIRAANGHILGAFAIYKARPSAPSGTDLSIMEQAARLASIAIERKQSEASIQLAASVFSHAQEGILITSVEGNIIDVNEAFTRITGYSRDEVLGYNPQQPRAEHGFHVTLCHELAENGQWHGEAWNRRKNGEMYIQMQTISAVHDADGQVQHYVALFSDVTTSKEQQRQLEQMAHYDALTSLPNRVLLADRLKQGMVQAQRRGQALAVAFLDLDGFKAVNDRHGHEAGDQLLIALSSNMKHALREGDTLARMGGDEFVAVLVDLEDVSASVPMLTRLLACAAEAVHICGHTLQVSASLGVTFYPQADDVDADQLLRQADQAMYQAKLAGKDRCHVFDAAHDSSIRGHHESIENIRTALERQEFVLHYQPKVNLRTGAIIGVEALIRWQHPQQGLLPPSVFLPVIEDNPLAIDIGEWVIDSALTQIALWRAAGLTMSISVNLGARQLQQANFIERLRYLLDKHPDVSPSLLELEVLETSALEDLVRVSQIMSTCVELGINFALDDFGTGYSSLTYLKRLPVAMLKIDQSFVRDMLDDVEDLAILDGVVGLASAFRRKVIAEGVETPAHGALLLQLGCELAQGYGIARPMPAPSVPHWAATWRPDPTWAHITCAEREDMPLLFASVELRGWSKAVENFLWGTREAPPELEQANSPFGKWLRTEGAKRYGSHLEFAGLTPLHKQLHTLTNKLCEMYAEGHGAAALMRLDELHVLRDALLAQTAELLPNVSY